MTKIMKYELKLNKGLGPLVIGMNKHEVENIIGVSEDSKSLTHYYYDNCLQLEYDNNNDLVFIQLSNNLSIVPIFNNMNLFEAKDSEVEDIFKQYGELNRNDPEFGYVYEFPSLHLNFWRESNPKVLELELNELDKKSEEYNDEVRYYQGEIKKSHYFQTVAVFSDGYY